MAETPRHVFPHRRNLDGTYDSICTLCFQTVATEGVESELLEAEKSHVCSTFDLGRITYPPQGR
jgi:hypothetical protein